MNYKIKKINLILNSFMAIFFIVMSAVIGIKINNYENLKAPKIEKKEAFIPDYPIHLTLNTSLGDFVDSSVPVNDGGINIELELEIYYDNMGVVTDYMVSANITFFDKINSGNSDNFYLIEENTFEEYINITDVNIIEVYAYLGFDNNYELGLPYDDPELEVEFDLITNENYFIYYEYFSVPTYENGYDALQIIYAEQPYLFYDVIYTNVYELGYSDGYRRGYDNGVDETQGLEMDVSIISDIFDAANTIFSVEVFPGFKLWYLIGAPLIVALIIAVLKFLR